MAVCPLHQRRWLDSEEGGKLGEAYRTASIGTSADECGRWCGDIVGREYEMSEGVAGG
jgi:hypothetical protein